MGLFGMGRKSKPMTQRIAEAEEANRLAEIHAKTAKARAEMEAFDAILGQDPEKALLLIRPTKYSKLLAIRQGSDSGKGSALKEVLEQLQLMRQLQEVLAPEGVQEIEVPDDTPGWLAAIVNSSFGEKAGEALGEAIRRGMAGQETPATDPAAQIADAAPPPWREALPSGSTEEPAELPALSFMQSKALLVMLDHRKPEAMAAQLMQSAAAMPQLLGLLNMILMMGDDEVMPFLGQLANQKGWEGIVGWLVSHQEYTLALVAELRRLAAEAANG